MAPRFGLLSRIRARLSAPRRAVGPAFLPEHEEVWDELVEQIDAELKKVGSAVVGAWEVGAAELGRVVIGRADDRAAIERYSDALVPTLQPFQDLHKGCAAAMAEGKRAGRASGRLADATAPLLRLVEGLGARAAAGWDKTARHLEPVLAGCPEGAEDRFRAGGPALVDACARAEQVYRERLAALHDAPDLWRGLTGATEAWQLALTRELEFVLDRHAKGLVADVARAR